MDKIKQIVHTEYEDCIALADYLRFRHLRFTHIANENGMKMPIGVYMKRRKMGLSPGVPDFMIIIKGHLLFIEMKREKGGVVSDFQKDWIEDLNKVENITARVCKGFNEARLLVDSFL